MDKAKIRVLFIAAVLLVGSFALFSSQAEALTGSSAKIKLVSATCTTDLQCFQLKGQGWSCVNFNCEQCPGSPGACQGWSGSGRCGIGNLPDGTGCGVGGSCRSGACTNSCTSDANCGGATPKCDRNNGLCVACDPSGNGIQALPTPAFGGGLCEAACGASLQCDELAINANVGGGYCDSQCKWKDPEADPAACAVVGGQWQIGGEVATNCCGNNPGEFARYRECDNGVCTTDVNDKACCTLPTKCVYGGSCYYDIDSAKPLVAADNTAFCAGKNQNSCISGESKQKCAWNTATAICEAAMTPEAIYISQKPGSGSNSYLYKVYANVNTNPSFEKCVAASPGKWFGGVSGIITGTVRNVSLANGNGPCPPEGCPVEGALVTLQGTSPQLSASTAADGSYTIINVPAKNYDVVASKTNYDTAIILSFTVPDSSSVTADFLLTRPLGNCNDDCTKADGLCHAECQGKGLCSYYSEETRQTCDNSVPGIVSSGSEQVLCCTNALFSPIQARVQLACGENLLSAKIPVLFKGKLVNMVFAVFDSVGCK